MPYTPSEPMDSGSTQGQIKTPMSSTNVGAKSDPKHHDYSKATGSPGTGGGSSIKGPGAQATPWPGEPSTGGNNLKY